MLKSDLHLHVKGDPEDRVPYSAQQLIDRAAALKYDILAITCHDRVLYSKAIVSYAHSKGILLIPGAETTLGGKHVLLYNITNEDLKKITSFNDIRELKKQKNILVIAPHPYFPTSFCLGNMLERHIGLFDAIEYSHYHTHFFNLNRKATHTARKHNKPIIGNSDSHHFRQFATTYSLIDSEKNANAVIAAIKAGNVRVFSPSLPLSKFFQITAWIFKTLLLRKFGLYP